MLYIAVKRCELLRERAFYKCTLLLLLWLLWLLCLPVTISFSSSANVWSGKWPSAYQAATFCRYDHDIDNDTERYRHFVKTVGMTVLTGVVNTKSIVGSDRVCERTPKTMPSLLRKTKQVQFLSDFQVLSVFVTRCSDFWNRRRFFCWTCLKNV